MESSAYLTALYSIINQIRYQRQPFCHLKICLEGDNAGEQQVGQICVLDYHGMYKKDYYKFMGEVTPKAHPGQ